MLEFEVFPGPCGVVQSTCLPLMHRNDSVGDDVRPHPCPLPQEREDRWPVRVGGTVW